MEKNQMKQFFFRLNWHDAIQTLPEEDRLQMYEAICGYARDGKEPDNLDACLRMAFSLIREDIDAQRRMDKEYATGK